MKISNMIARANNCQNAETSTFPGLTSEDYRRYCAYCSGLHYLVGCMTKVGIFANWCAHLVILVHNFESDFTSHVSSTRMTAFRRKGSLLDKKGNYWKDVWTYIKVYPFIKVHGFLENNWDFYEVALTCRNTWEIYRCLGALIKGWMSL